MCVKGKITDVKQIQIYILTFKKKQKNFKMKNTDEKSANL